MKNKYVAPLARGIIAALVMFVAGFGALNAFWYLGEYDSLLPGLYDYRAATWGDGLFLSAGAGALVSLASARSATGRQRAVSCAVAFVALIGALYVQYTWVACDDTGLNWTLPAQHAFNAAGVYHAVYFCACAAFFTYQLSRFWLVGRVLRQNGADVPLKPLEILVWFAAAGYLEMHVIDDYSGALPQPYLSILAIVLLVPFVVLLYVSMRGVRQGMRDSLMLVPGALFALGMSLALSVPSTEALPPAIFSFSIACVLVSSFSIPRGSLDKLINAYLSALLSGMGLMLVMVSVSGAEQSFADGFFSGVVVCGFGFLLYVVELVRLAYWGRYGISFTLYGVGTALATVVWGLAVVASLENAVLKHLLHFILTFAIVGLMILRAKNAMLVVLSIEEKASSSPEGRNTALLAQGAVYPLICAMSVGVVIMLMFDMLSLSPNELNSEAASLFATNDVGFSLLCFLAFAGMLVMGAFVVRRMGSVSRAVLLSTFVISLYMVLFAYVTGLRRPFDFDWWYVWGVFSSAGASAFVGESLVSNCALIRGGKCDAAVLSVAVIVAVGCHLVAVGAMMPTVGVRGELFPTFLSPCIGVLGVAMAFIALPAFASVALVMRSSALGSRLLVNSPVSGVMQNGASAMVMVIFLGILPMELCASVPHVLLFMVPFLILVSSKINKLFFPLHMNAKHLTMCVGKCDSGSEMESPDRLDELRCLSRHLQRQALLAMTALLPWVLVSLALWWAQRRLVWWAQGLGWDPCEAREELWCLFLLRMPSKEAAVLFVELFPGHVSCVQLELDELADEAIQCRRGRDGERETSSLMLIRALLQRLLNRGEAV